MSQYYQFLQQQPDLAHQFYTDASTMVRVDGNDSETATTMQVMFRSNRFCPFFSNQHRLAWIYLAENGNASAQFVS